ncbi:GNAT family N-acetyltransferase [Amphibacillus sp. Q70]|uniref:GNAT family N-acetyltransferase n=1 Tax=Amphibacillus sp. Q70 TaxID=3453416 RepID=UPI003F84CDD2
MTVLLKTIDQSNYKACAELTVLEDQEDFITPNWYSLLEANYEADRLPFAIYEQENLVGFIMFSYYPADADYPLDSWWIERFMIDQEYQNKGYGTKALSVAVSFFKEKINQKELRISAVPNNQVAIKLYENLGFVRTGEHVDGEQVLLLKF